MPSSAWLAAANKTDRRPVLAMSIESTDAINVSIFDRAGWEAGPVQTNIVTNSPLDDAGVVIMATDGAEVHAGVYQGNLTEVGPSSGYVATQSIPWSPVGGFSGGTSPSVDGTNGRVVSVTFNITSFWDNADGVQSRQFTIQGSRDGGTWLTLATFVAGGGGYGYFTYHIPLSKGAWSFRLACNNTDLGVFAWIRNYITDYETSHVPTAYTQTKSIDLGLIPTDDSVFAVNDRSSAIATLVYTARGSNDNATWTALGTVTDGDALAPYRYYDFTASFTSTGPDTPMLREIGVSGGDSQYKTYSTHEDVPTLGAKPYLQASISPLNTKIELMKLGSIGEVSPKLFFLRGTFDLLKDGYLRNKLVQVKHGFLGMAAADFEPIFTGLWYDGSIDFNQGTINIKTRSIFSRFAKVKLPAERALGGVRDDLTCPPWERINANIMDVMLDLAEAMGMPDRYLDRASFTALSTGARAGADWNISRRIDKDAKEDATKLMEELSVLAGVFLLQQPNGKISAQLYDPAAANVAEISTDYATFSPLELGQAELFTRQQILYNPRHVNDLDDGIARGTWVLGKTYAIGDMVINLAGTAYNCTSVHTAVADQQPGVGTAWESMWALGTVAGTQPWVWASGMDFDRADTIYRTGIVYRCLAAHQSTSATEPAVGPARRAYWATEWIDGTDYDLGDTVTKAGPLYTCINAHTATTATTPTVGASYRSAWYSAPVKKSNSDEDFYNAFVKINNAAEINWGLNDDVISGDPEYQAKPGYQKTWQEKWNATDAARSALADRMDAWFANPKAKIKASDLPPRFYSVGLGQMVGVTGLMLPTSGATWGVPSNNKKFMVMSKTFDPAACTVSLDLLEI